ncbi:MAG: uroporphyrinogen-III C-methyltransferase [Planctomycetes bacterium]|nr:uroporphyrinogen-III C-methyltransferase [Planctomycetota bacterium]
MSTLFNRRYDASHEEHATSNSKQAIVYLVGAGPGDPGLLTLRGKECLERADFVLYDQLVSPQLLKYAPESAEKMCVRELADSHPDRWPHVHVKLIEEARLGKCVVRLKGGDPLIFGRGGEEAAALREAGIPYEIVPGVTAALAAGAYLEIPLTHRSLASAVAFITGHEHPGKPTSRIDWKMIAAFPGTIVIYMGFSRLNSIIPELILHGKEPGTPAISVSRASTGEQQSVTATLATLDDAIRGAGLTTPALVIIGPVVGLRPVRSWFEERPLLGKRVLITRPRQQAEEFAQRLQELGATPLLLPAIEIRDPADWATADAAMEKLRDASFDWVIFTSVNGVEKFFNRLKARGRDLRDLGATKLAVIGSATADKLRTFHLEPDVVPGESMNSERLLLDLRERIHGKSVLLVTAEQGRESLRLELAAICKLDVAVVYTQVEGVDARSEILNLLRRGEIDCVTLTSPNIARAFLAACDETIIGRLQRGEIHVLSSNSRTSAVVRERGIQKIMESAKPTNESMIGVMLKMYAI